MPFEVGSETVNGNVHVLTVNGELDLGTSPAFREPLEGILEKKKPSLLIDLTDCEFIDSTGVALIVEAWHRLEDRGSGRLVLCCPNPQVQRVLEITGINSSISMHAEREDALADLRG